MDKSKNPISQALIVSRQAPYTAFILTMNPSVSVSAVLSPVMRVIYCTAVTGVSTSPSVKHLHLGNKNNPSSFMGFKGSQLFPPKMSLDINLSQLNSVNMLTG
jgi:hypothetical protein